MILNLVSPPESEPVSLEEVEGQVRCDLTSEQSTVDLMISAVREQVESITRRSFITQSWELILDAFPSVGIVLPKPPLQTVNYIKYIDVNGVEQTLASNKYKVLSKAEPAYIVPAYGLSWPVARNEDCAVTIGFTCGYGPIVPEEPVEGTVYPDNIPKAIKQWCLINIASLFENREAVVISNGREAVLDLTSTLADGLIENYRITKL